MPRHKKKSNLQICNIQMNLSVHPYKPSSAEAILLIGFHIFQEILFSTTFFQHPRDGTNPDLPLIKMNINPKELMT